jgi:cystine transport system substrate-binding protein
VKFRNVSTAQCHESVDTNDLAIGRIDATISSYFGGTKYAKDKNLPIREVGPILTYQLSAAAMPKQQPTLRAAVSAAVESMIADGTIDRLSERWVGVSYRMSEEIRRAQGRWPRRATQSRHGRRLEPQNLWA